jgi:hypothetical protein
MFPAGYVEGTPPRWTPTQMGGLAIIGDGQMGATQKDYCTVTHDDISFAQCNCGVVHIVTSQLAR